MVEEKHGFGTPIEKIDNPELKERTKKHLGKEYLAWTPGQICSSVDVCYGQADPRIVAARKAQGDFTAAGGLGPRGKKS